MKALSDLFRFIAILAAAALFTVMCLLIPIMLLMKKPLDPVWEPTLMIIACALVLHLLGRLLAYISRRRQYEDKHKFIRGFCDTDVHGWFGLSYANYSVVPRSLLQSMPARWQHDFVELMKELDEKYGGYDLDYSVNKRDENGKFMHDELANYERGRRQVPPKPYEWK